MTILCVLDTDLKGFSGKKLTRNNGKNHLLCYSGSLSKSVKGVCPMIKPNKQVDFERISKMIIKLDNQNNRLIILSLCTRIRYELQKSRLS